MNRAYVKEFDTWSDARTFVLNIEHVEGWINWEIIKYADKYMLFIRK